MTTSRKSATPTRISIAEGLTKSKKEVPAASATTEAFAEKLVWLKNHRSYKEKFKNAGTKLSYTSLISWAAVEGIKNFPIFRSRWEEETSDGKKKYFINEF